MAALRGDLPTFRAALARGETVLGSTDPAELTSLHLAAGAGHLELVGWLLDEARADPNARRNNSFTPLHSAAMAGHTAVVDRLLRAGADPNVQTDPQGYTPMHSAAFGGHVDVVRLFLAAGARTDLRNYRNEIPSETAARQGQRGVVSLLRPDP